MKKIISLLIICVIFVFNYKPHYFAYADSNEMINFYFQDSFFEYNLSENIKNSDVFDIDYEINKYDRFSNYETRKDLINKLLKVGFDAKIVVNYMFPNIDNCLSKIAKNIYIPPKNAQCQINSKSEKVFKIDRERTGRQLDYEKIYIEIIDSYLKNDSPSIEIPVIHLEPKISSEFFKKHSNLRADFSTDISSSSVDRKHNIKNALNSLNKVEILPNQIFSFNETVGRRTEKNGYRTAKIIVDNEFVDGIGGGVCQVSTTLYYASLMAGLDIVEANRHSRQVGYIMPGFDAMVNFGSSDLRVKNNTGQKITIITNYSPSKARIRLFGEDLNGKTYKLVNKISNIVEPMEEIKVDNKGEYVDKVEFEDESFCLQSGSRGMTIETYRECYQKGRLINSLKLRKDVFKAKNKIVVVGAKKRTESICA